jgi:hypothetical protein
MTALPAEALTMAPGGFTTAVLIPAAMIIPEDTIIPAVTKVVVTVAAAVTAVEVVMEAAEIESRGTLLFIPFTGLR